MKINKAKYQGYLWYSNETKPRVLRNEDFELEILDSANPFIVEGQLFDGSKSISIKYVDGKYIYTEYDLSTLKDKSFDNMSFIPNHMKGIEKLKFRQYWRLVEDSLCEKMLVPQPAELVFVGFTNKED